MQADLRLVRAFEVASNTAETGRPGEVMFNCPDARQEKEATLGGGQLGDPEADTLCGGLGGGSVPGITLEPFRLLWQS